MARVKAFSKARAELLEQATLTTWEVSIDEQALFVAMSTNAFARTDAQADEVLSFVAQIRTVTLRELPLTQMPKLNERLRQIDQGVKDSKMASPRWVGSMTALNLLVAGLGVYDLKRRGWKGWADSLSDVGAIGLGLGGGTAGLMRFLKFAAAEGVGAGVAIAGCFISGVEAGVAFHEGRQADGMFATVSAVGSGMLIASLYGWEVPVVGGLLAAAGGTLMIGSTVASWVWSNREVFRTDMQKWWVDREDAFQNGVIYKQVSAKVPALGDKTAKLLEAITSTAFPLIAASQENTLRLIVPTGDLPKLMAHRPQ